MDPKRLEEIREFTRQQQAQQALGWYVWLLKACRVRQPKVFRNV